MKKPAPALTELPPPPGERFFKIRSTKTGLFKCAGIGERWSKTGKVWSKKTLAGHFALFKRENYPANGGTLPRPELEQGAVYYVIPDEYQIVEYFALGDVVPLENVMRVVLSKGAVIARNGG